MRASGAWLAALFALASCTRSASPGAADAEVERREQLKQQLEHDLEQLKRLSAELNEADAASAPSFVTLDQQERNAGAKATVFQATLLENPRMPVAADRGKTAWVVSHEAHWLVHLRVDELLSPESPFQAGTQQRFVVHSPTQLFEGQGTVKSSYRFRVVWETREDGGARVRWLELDRGTD